MDQEKLRKLEELKKQRDELNKLISELTEQNTLNTNIPYTSEFTSLYPQYKTQIDFNSLDPTELLQIKVFVNKKCNQVSTDFEHTITLANQIIPYKSNQAFKEIFIRKVLEQGRIQVSSHIESYKPFSFLLYRLDSPEIINDYLKMLIWKEGSENELKGMYAIYFGILNLKADLDSCWIWIASVLNSIPNTGTGYVLELFLTICGDLLFERLPGRFMKLINYIKNYTIKELKNPPVELRILNYIDKYKI